MLLLERLKGKQYEVLQVAHNGSKYSSSTEFLDTVKPQYSLISAGKNNVYGHPHKETIERLERAESRIYSTQKNGAITISVAGSKMKIKIFATEK
jgi:competence protein ComEC